MDSPPVLLELGSELGDSYLAAMQLAGEYAYAGRDVVVAKVLEILGAEAVHEVHNHHNFAWQEQHVGSTYWVVRKGCTPAWPGQEGFVRLDGRRVRHPRGSRRRRQRCGALLDGARRRTHHEPLSGSGPSAPPEALGLPEPRLCPHVRRA